MKIFVPGLLILIFSIAVVPTVFADEELDDEGEYTSEIERDQEREREHDDDDEELVLGGGIPDAILYGTIAVIVGSIAYTGFRIYKTKKPRITAE